MYIKHLLLIMVFIVIANDDAWEGLPNAEEIKEIEKDFDEYMSEVHRDWKKRVRKMRKHPDKRKGPVPKVLPK